MDKVVVFLLIKNPLRSLANKNTDLFVAMLSTPLKKALTYKCYMACLVSIYKCSFIWVPVPDQITIKGCSSFPLNWHTYRVLLHFPSYTPNKWNKESSDGWMIGLTVGAMLCFNLLPQFSSKLIKTCSTWSL